MIEDGEADVVTRGRRVRFFQNVTVHIVSSRQVFEIDRLNPVSSSVR